MSRNTSNRQDAMHDFLRSSIKQYEVAPLTSDASFRSYHRVYDDKGRSLILMDSPTEHYSLDPFIKIAKLLLREGFSAPEIYETDHHNGFLLLEDFGDITAKKHLQQQNARGVFEQYKLIVELLTALQNIEAPADLDIYNKEKLLQELELYTDWYLPYRDGHNVSKDFKENFLTHWQGILKFLPADKASLVLRDYHVENLMILPRPGIYSLGILDFQDAVIGSPIYDLVSVLEDARFEVSSELASASIEHYIKCNPRTLKKDVHISYDIFGAQRNMRILGVFARKIMRDQQPSYGNYMPLVEGYLRRDLSHDYFKSLLRILKI